jgi:hypothetical protein
MSILALTSDTLIGTPAAGNIEYNGQFYGTDSNAARAQMQRITSGTAVATTSGTSINFTDIPAWAKRITIAFQGISTNGTSLIQVQLGDSGGIENTGYSSGAWTANTSNANSTTGFIVCGTLLAGYTFDGVATLVLLNSSTNLWSFSSILANGTSAITSVGGGSKALSATLDRVRLTTVGGTETFDAGSINILYEG